MNGYLFDTNVLVEIMRGNRALLARMKEVGYALSFVSEMTVVETLYGAYISGRKEAEVQKTKRLLSQFNVLSLRGAEETMACIKADLRRKGTPVEDADLMIAATAMANGLTLISNNIRHFSRIEGWHLKTGNNSTQ